MNKQLLQSRNEKKKNKPDFFMQGFHRKKRLQQKWRRPKGGDSKMRLHLKGYHMWPCKGYSSPQEVRGMHRSGFMPIIINNISELSKINKATEGIIVAAGVGTRNKLAILKKAQELKITIINIKNPYEFAKRKEAEFEEKTKKKAEKLAEKEKKTKEKEKKSAEKKKDISDTLTDDEKKEQEKKEKDKTLIQKEK